MCVRCPWGNSIGCTSAHDQGGRCFDALAGDLACRRSVEQMSERKGSFKLLLGRKSLNYPRRQSRHNPGGSREQKLPRKTEKVVLAP